MVSVLQSGTDTGFLALPYSAKAAPTALRAHWRVLLPFAPHCGFGTACTLLCDSAAITWHALAHLSHRERLQLRKHRYEQLQMCETRRCATTSRLVIFRGHSLHEVGILRLANIHGMRCEHSQNEISTISSQHSQDERCSSSY
jgi:hypothetical protein